MFLLGGGVVLLFGLLDVLWALDAVERFPIRSPNASVVADSTDQGSALANVAAAFAHGRCAEPESVAMGSKALGCFLKARNWEIYARVADESNGNLHRVFPLAAAKACCVLVIHPLTDGSPSWKSWSFQPLLAAYSAHNFKAS